MHKKVAPEPPIPFPKVHLTVFLWEPLYLLYAPQNPKTINMETGNFADFGRWFLLNASSTWKTPAPSASSRLFPGSTSHAVKRCKTPRGEGPQCLRAFGHWRAEVVARLGPCRLLCIWNHKVTASTLFWHQGNGYLREYQWKWTRINKK